MPASESTEARPSRPSERTESAATTPDPSSVSMSDLLASCAAASAVSTPPPAESPRADETHEADEAA